MKIHFTCNASINGWKVSLDNYIEAKQGVFEHSVYFGKNLVCKRQGSFDKNWSFDQFCSWRARRARFHFEEAMKKKATM